MTIDEINQATEKFGAYLQANGVPKFALMVSIERDNSTTHFFSQLGMTTTEILGCIAIHNDAILKNNKRLP